MTRGIGLSVGTLDEKDGLSAVTPIANENEQNDTKHDYQITELTYRLSNIENNNNNNNTQINVMQENKEENVTK